MSYQALELDGNGYASIADGSQAGLNMGLSDFMIEGWIKTTVTAADYIFIKSEAGVSRYYLSTSSGKLRALIDDGTNVVYKNSVADINDGRWEYLAVVFDRSDTIKLYINGSYDSESASISGVGDVDNGGNFTVGILQMLLDEVRIWNFGYGGLPADYADYITWRAAGRNRFLDISEYNSGGWNLYADAERTGKHDGSGTVAGLVVGMKYGYVTATPHTLDYQGGTLDDDGVFTATHTTGTIASGDADDHVWRVGLVARYKFNGDYTDETSNSNDLTAGGTGNVFPEYTLRHKGQKMLLGVI